MANTTEIVGLEHAIKQFRRAPVLARKYIGEAVAVTEITLAGKVRAGAAVRTGALKHAIGSSSRGLNARIVIEGGAFYGGQRPDTYWRFVEFGTRHMAAQPFIRPAAETEGMPFVRRVEKAGSRLERALDT